MSSSEDDEVPLSKAGDGGREKEFSWHLGERICLFFIVACGLLISIHSLTSGSWFFGDVIEQYLLAPFTEDVESQDGTYNLVNTAVYAILLLVFVVTIAAVMRSTSIPADERLLMAFVPWIIWGSTARVLEDSGFFTDSLQTLYISPVIHFHTAAWVTVCLAIGCLIRAPSAHLSGIDSERRRVVIATVVIFLAHVTIVVLPDMGSETSTGWSVFPIAGLVAGCLLSITLPRIFVAPDRAPSMVLGGVGTAIVAMHVGLFFSFLFIFYF